jgi:hypothetical protein
MSAPRPTPTAYKVVYCTVNIVYAGLAGQLADIEKADSFSLRVQLAIRCPHSAAEALYISKSLRLLLRFEFVETIAEIRGGSHLRFSPI